MNGAYTPPLAAPPLQAELDTSQAATVYAEKFMIIVRKRLAGCIIPLGAFMFQTEFYSSSGGLAESMI